MATPKNFFIVIVLDGPLVEFLKNDGSKVTRFPKMQLPCTAKILKSLGLVQQGLQFSKTSNVEQFEGTEFCAEGEYIFNTNPSKQF